MALVFRNGKVFESQPDVELSVDKLKTLRKDLTQRMNRITPQIQDLQDRKDALLGRITELNTMITNLGGTP